MQEPLSFPPWLLAYAVALMDAMVVDRLKLDWLLLCESHLVKAGAIVIGERFEQPSICKSQMWAGKMAVVGLK